jgi:hypothetical protein
MYNGERATDAKTRSKRALAVGGGSDDLFLGYPTTMQKKIRAGIVFRAARGGRADQRPPIEDTNLIFESCGHQQGIRTIWEYQVVAATPLQTVYAVVCWVGVHGVCDGNFNWDIWHFDFANVYIHQRPLGVGVGVGG